MRFGVYTFNQPAFLTAFAAAMIISAVASSGPQTRSLTRSEDYIQFLGDDVPSLIGAEVRDLHLYACSRSGFRAVPFQIDKRDSEGRYVFPNETMRDPLRDGTRLDENDELVFMIKDAGDRCPEDAWIDSAVKGVEIELLDPAGGGRAWVCLFDRPGAIPPDTQDYISYESEGERELIQSENYRMGVWMNQVGMYLLRLRRPDGSWGEDILESQKAGLVASLLRGAIPIYLPEQEIKKRITGVIDGPVRVIRDQLSFMRIKVLGLEMITETYYTNYFNGHVSPMEVNLPMTISKVFLNFDMYWALGFNRAIHGSVYRNPANPRGVALDGKPDPRMDADSAIDHLVISGPEGSIVEVIDLGDFGKHDMIVVSLVAEEPSKKEPENAPGEILAGYWYRNSSKIPRGHYAWMLYHYYVHPFSDDKVEEILNMIHHPVEIKVQPISSPTVAP
jgi:hypothetical protein